jgi:hypothetical protein
VGFALPIVNFMACPILIFGMPCYNYNRIVVIILRKSRGREKFNKNNFRLQNAKEKCKGGSEPALAPLEP